MSIPYGFEAIVSEPELAAVVKDSPGLNFGSVHLGPGFTTWPPGREPYGAQRDHATDIFGFDTLVQNPDRRAVNPNLWARSDGLGVYDHEQAFSFLSFPVIGGAPKPWATANHGNAFRFLEQHVFYRGLRGGRLDFGPFKERLGTLTDGKIQGYANSAPDEWRNDGQFSNQIVDYLREAREQRENLIQFIKHILR